jgi:predicted DNA binding CopG/RHH family protein
MPAKKVSFGRKPNAENPVDVEEWVAKREALQAAEPAAALEDKAEKMKRLTLDIPEGLHKAVKRKALDEGMTMAELLRSLLEEHYGSKG